MAIILLLSVTINNYCTCFSNRYTKERKIKRDVDITKVSMYRTFYTIGNLLFPQFILSFEV